MTSLTQGTWVLVADSEKALFLENTTDAQNPNLQVRRKDEQENPSDREQSANRPGRFNDGPSVHRSAVDDTDWHELAKERFAKDLSDKLYEMAHRGDFEKLVLVAAPEVLGELRKNLHKEVSDCVIGEISKNLTGHEIGKIEEMVKDALRHS
ncbi:host attachment family protein [Leisingera daeponensis]|uniref:Host attachment family protein n=1 Tax=Leisingera daeponensis TaxID=405746 RepID=A0ABS7NBM1_9RHOB|nr:host attachment family protein [Leisingera daeponensis]MBY6055784.1 host attachment family protein [Leisingera daeponensis]MBY6138601.1 host attachment family protein [Leisingera daeponensis]